MTDSRAAEIAAVDEVLATTRAVRRRLDLARPVDNQLLLDCIDVAEQAPTGGGHRGSRRWIIVRDQAVKDQLGELYRQATQAFAARAERRRSPGHPHERPVASALFLIEHLAEVPAIVIPTIIGRYDGRGGPGLFDSVIQAAWSFCLALRARGLGTAWTTQALEDQDRVKAILGIPAYVTEIVLLPVAWTKGTDFRRATRHPARAITYFDRFGSTSERGPGPTLRFADGPGAVAEMDVDAPISVVWDLVTDPAVATRFSTEARGAEWEDAARGPGAVSVDVSSQQRSFGWPAAGPDHPDARWRFDLEPVAGRTRLRFSYVIDPGPSATTATLAAHPDREAQVLRPRLDAARTAVARTVEGIKALAEHPG